MKIKITVFTPTYNRAYIIENLYRSLQRQVIKNFEWLIVDDGSSDNTEELINKWIKEDDNLFPIIYYKKANGGKCSAINYALDKAKGELFFTVDSDDYLTNDALLKITQWEKELPDKNLYCGFAGNLGTSIKDTPNKLFEGGYLDGTALNRYDQVDGERAMVFYTNIHKKYKYPLFSNEKFMTEAVAWNRMANDGYKMRFYNDIIWIYEYKEDGLTKAGNSLFLNNPQGYGLWLKEKALFSHASLKNILKLYYSYTCEVSESLNIRAIAKYIQAPVCIIVINYLLHKISIHRIKF